MDVERVAIAGRFVPPEIDALRQAAQQVNEYLERTEPITAQLVHRLHGLASQGIPWRGFDVSREFPAELAGRYRPVDVSGDGSTVVDITIDPEWVDVSASEAVEAQMVQFFVRLTDALQAPHDATALAAEAYARFVKIHPYLEANDRIGWLLLNWILLRGGQRAFYVTNEHVESYVRLGQTVMRQPLSEAIRICQEYFGSAGEPADPSPDVPGLPGGGAAGSGAREENRPPDNPDEARPERVPQPDPPAEQSAVTEQRVRSEWVVGREL